MIKQGVVLISTLFIVMIMSMITIQISKSFFISIQRDAYLDFKNYTLHLLLSSETQAINSIKKQIIISKNKLTKEDPILKQSYFFSNDFETVQVDVSDASNCFNLNNIFKKNGDEFEIIENNRKWLERLLRLEDLDELVIESFVDQLIDWVDSNNQPLNFGVENYFYIGPLSDINQFTPKRLLVSVSEIKNFPIMDQLSFEDITKNLCVLPGSSNQIININTLNPEHTKLIASFFNIDNLQLIESQILEIPKNGYDSTNEFIINFNQIDSSQSQLLSLNSNTFFIKSKIYNEIFTNELESLVVLDISNSAKVLNRNFIF